MNRKLQMLFSFCLSSHQLFTLSALGFLQRKEVPVLIKGAAALSPRVLQWPLPAGVLAALLLSRFLPGTSAAGNAFAGVIAASLFLSAFTDGLTPASAGAAA